MNPHHCIIIEDEPLALERTKIFVEKIPFLHLSATFDNALMGLAYLKANNANQELKLIDYQLVMFL